MTDITIQLVELVQTATCAGERYETVYERVHCTGERLRLFVRLGTDTTGLHVVALMGWTEVPSDACISTQSLAVSPEIWRGLRS
jgi:hypothetical protein